MQISYSQDNELKLGKTINQISGSVYDLSDPTGVNIEVNLWGFVRYPGRYIVPYNTTFIDLMSFSGGPTESSNLEEIRILRPAKDSTSLKSTILKLNYDDLLWGDKIKQSKKNNPILQAGDIILIMEQKRYSLRDNLLLIIPIFSGIISLATFIITIYK
jgi:hypothetical protein